jgi:hypothetical protein
MFPRPGPGYYPDVSHIHRSSRGIAADPDIVLNTAADLTRAAAWLPEPVHVLDSGDGTLDVAWRPDGSARRFAVTVSADDRRVEWRPADHDGVTGQLVVTDQGAGASAVELRLEVGDDVRDQDVDRLLEQALAGLATEVDQNFNVS